MEEWGRPMPQFGHEAGGPSVPCDIVRVIVVDMGWAREEAVVRRRDEADLFVDDCL